MIILSTIILALAALAFGVVCLNVLGWRRPGREAGAGVVSLLIPARNEAANLPACLDAAVGQLCVTEIIVADDHSSDATAEIVKAYAAKDPRVKLVRPDVLPDGWCGKTHACHSLALTASGDWLLFLDADTRLQPDAVPRMLAECRNRQLTMLSCWPQLEMHGFFERLLMPLLNFVLLTLYPAPLAARRPDARLGLAHGACILMRTEEYRRFGGHTRVKAELFEDTRLAQLWRGDGLRSLCLDGTGVVSVRMYSSLGEIWSGFRKNLFPAFKGQIGFWTFMLFHAAVFFAPFALMFTGGAAGILFAAAAGLVLASRVMMAIRFGHPIWSALLHPIGEFFVLLIGMASWLQVVTGRGVEWKGRRYRGTATLKEAA
ncbi:MAG: glycosyltransferase [Planctomycetes bacterium]|nr:glycosyltransferase [Planctomycetota bacterium]